MSKKIITLLIVLALVFAGCTSVNEEETAPVESKETEAVVEETSTETEEVQSAEGYLLQDVSEADFDDIIPNTQGVAIVDFWASWCGPCLALGPVLEEISQENGYQLYKVDVDKNPELSSRFAINAIPMVQIYKDGELVDSFVGALPKDSVEEILNKHK